MLKEKAVEGLEQIHTCDIVHEDPAMQNLRVEIEDGKISHAWFIDFGKAWLTYSDENKVHSKTMWELMLQELIDQSSDH